MPFALRSPSVCSSSPRLDRPHAIEDGKTHDYQQAYERGTNKGSQLDGEVVFVAWIKARGRDCLTARLGRCCETLGN